MTAAVRLTERGRDHFHVCGSPQTGLKLVQRSLPALGGERFYARHATSSLQGRTARWTSPARST